MKFTPSRCYGDPYEVDIQNKGSYVEIEIIKSGGYLTAETVIKEFLNKFKSPYASRLEYNSLLELIQYKEDELKELKLARSVFGKKAFIKKEV